MGRGTFTIYERGLPGAAVYAFDIPDDHVPNLTDVPTGARGAAFRAHCVTYMSEYGDLWVIKDTHYHGVLPKLLLSEHPDAPLLPIPVPASMVNEIRRRFTTGYNLYLRADLVKDIGILLQCIDSKVNPVTELAEVIPLFPKDAA